MCITVFLAKLQYIARESFPSCREKIKLNFYFHTSLWYLRRFYEGLKGLQKPFWNNKKKWENKKFGLIFISIKLSEMHGTLRVNHCFNPITTQCCLLYPFKIWENLWFSNVFKGYKKATLGINWLIASKI